MEFNNKTILIAGLVVGGLLSVYVQNNELASVIFGGLIGYLSHSLPSSDNEDEVIEEIA